MLTKAYQQGAKAAAQAFNLRTAASVLPRAVVRPGTAGNIGTTALSRAIGAGKRKLRNAAILGGAAAAGSTLFARNAAEDRRAEANGPLPMQGSF